MRRAAGSSLWKDIRRRWVKAALLVLIIAESSLILNVFAQDLGPALNYGRVHYGCPNLQGSTVLNESMARWVVFSCPNGPALVITLASFTGFAHEPADAILLPTFTPPPGLLAIYTFGHGDFGGRKCPDPDQGISGWYNAPPMISGVSIVTFYTGLNYCAVLTGPAGTLNGFNIHWSVGNGGSYPLSSSMELSATDATVAHGQNATLRLTLKSLQSFPENVSFQLGFPGNTPNSSFTPSIYFKPRTLLLKSGGSNSTLVTIQVSPSQPPGDYKMVFYGIPVYRLGFYGDYLATPTYIGNQTLIHVTVT
jgi:hypothetical protein